jgi:RNA-splicing ligase RtcB
MVVLEAYLQFVWFSANRRRTMIEYAGKYATCQVMIDQVEETAVKQIHGFLNCPAFEGSKIRIMPDVHAGAGAVIGFTSTMTDKIIPNVVGVDIGCGVLSVAIGDISLLGGRIDFEGLDRHVRAEIPCGFNIHRRDVLGELERDDDGIDEILWAARETAQDEDHVLKSIGSLGGGNHFIELGKGEDGRLWLTIHTGSRHFGLQIAILHQGRAIEKLGDRGGFEWLEGEDAQIYYRHMRAAQLFAEKNRCLIVKRILHFFDRQYADDVVESVHNYIDFEDRMIRKGAIAAREGDRVVIPWNMRDGLIIGLGKGNADWNRSAPHGAGRTMGRIQAKRTLHLDEFRSTMEDAGVWSSCVAKDTLDKSPMAYKKVSVIRDAIGATVDVLHTVKPLYNFQPS